jgi:hypothetical protein
LVAYEKLVLDGVGIGPVTHDPGVNRCRRQGTFARPRHRFNGRWAAAWAMVQIVVERRSSVGAGQIPGRSSASTAVRIVGAAQAPKADSRMLRRHRQPSEVDDGMMCTRGELREHLVTSGPSHRHRLASKSHSKKTSGKHVHKYSTPTCSTSCVSDYKAKTSCTQGRTSYSRETTTAMNTKHEDK